MSSRNVMFLQNANNTGVNVPPWAIRTIPEHALPADTYAVSATSPQTRSRRDGGLLMDTGQVIQPYQSAWRPFNLRVNPLRVEPEQHSANSFAYYNTAFNSQYQPFPKLISSSGNFAMEPVQYGKGLYSFMNPVANSRYP